MITSPVSGSKNVKIDGIKKIIKTFNNLYFVLLVKITEEKITKIILTNSLGWKPPIKGIVNQDLLLLIGSAKKRSKVSIIIEII